jgi:hypothetical protein
MIRITASLVHKSGAEILRHDSSPIERAELRGAIEEAIAFLCDEDGYTVEEGGCRVVLRIEPASGVATTALPRLLEMPTQAQHRRTDAGTAQNAPALQR